MKHVSSAITLLFLLCFFSNAYGQSQLKKANKQYELSAYNLAIKSYNSVLDKNINNVEALSKIADCYRHLNQMTEAAKWYRKAIEQNGVDPIYIFQYAQVLKALGDYEKAKEWFLVFAEGRPVLGQHFAESCDFAISLDGVPPLYQVKNEYANSPASDFGITFYGDQVVYSSAREDIKRRTDAADQSWEGSTKNQLFITSIDANGFLGKPVFLQSDISNKGNIGPVSYSGNGKWVAYTKNNFVNGIRQIPSSGMELSIYVAEVTGSGDWSNAKPFPFNGSGYSSGFPHLSQDGRILYFASNRPDGFGGFDIYVTYRRGDSWSTPENLGAVVNSQGNEITPSIGEGSLYFASDWHHGLGGFDNFRAANTDGIWNKVYHLGNGVNSAGDDYGFINNEKNNTGYFTSNRIGGRGQEDIYQFSRSAANFLIKVTTTGTNKPIEDALVDFSACGEPVYKTDANGEYSFQAFDGLDCDVIVSKEGFKSFTFKMDTRNGAGISKFDIRLSNLSDDYLGRIVNAVDNSVVSGVRIKAIDQENGALIETTSDKTGEYRLPLENNRSYIIRFSKAGFTDTHNRISTDNGSNKNILGVLTFTPSGTNLESGTVVSAQPPKEKDTITEIEEEAKGKNKSAEATISELPASQDKEELTFEAQEGFAVQVAAVVVDQPVNVGKYLKLEDFGNVYSREEKGFKKVRIGIFPTRKDAEVVKADLAKKGYKSAFVVGEKVNSLEDIELYSKITPKMEKIPASKPAPTKPQTPATLIDSGYKVRLASYRNINSFKQSKVENIGQIEKRIKGDFTIVLLSGFSSLETAIEAKNRAIDSGFSGAHIVVEEDGRLKKVNL